MRVPQGLHQQLAKRSFEKGVSLNQLCVALLRQASQQGSEESGVHPELRDRVLPRLQEKFKTALMGVVLFGSVVKQEDTQSSDIDVLIVLKDVAIQRALYRWWDQHAEKINGQEVSPHFVTLPSDPKDISSLWLEVSETYQIVYQKDKKLESFLHHVYTLIQNGSVRKYWSNGHPYWVWRRDEK